MRKKKGFTLLEVMVALSIFALLSLMISAMLIQSQKILAKTDNSANMQNIVRTALLKIQSEAKDYETVEVIDKYGYFDGEKWQVVEGNTQSRELKSSTSSSYAREILRFSNGESDIAKIYVEVNENNKHQLVEFDINETTNEIVDNSKNVLIDNISGDGVESISVTDKDNKLIILDCSSMITEEGVNKSNYIATFAKKISKNIDLPNNGSGDSGSSGDKETNGDMGNSGTGGQGNITEEDDEEDEADADGWYTDWEKDGIKINMYADGGEWKINVQNESSFDIFGWEVLIKLDNGVVERYYNGKVDNLGNNIYKVYTDNFSLYEIKRGNSILIEGQYSGEITNNISNIIFRYKKIKHSDSNYLELQNGVGLKLAMITQWQGTAQWKIGIKNSTSQTVNKWELIFEFEKPLKSVGWGLQFEDLGNGKYKIKNTEQNAIYGNNQREITFESDSGVLDRNLKNVEFNIIN